MRTRPPRAPGGRLGRSAPAGRFAAGPAGDRRPGAPASPLGLGVLVLAVLPLALVSADQAALVRYVFPASVALLAGYLYARSPHHYFAFCLWLFLLTPFIRRVVDLQAGWQHVSPIMLAPYLAASLMAVAFVRYLLRRDNPCALSLLLVLAAVAYGLLLAVLYGRVVSGLFEALRWGVPPLAAAFVLHHAHHVEVFRTTLLKAFGVALPLLGAYGIVQYAFAPPWDAYWMANAPIGSIGRPEPFEIRVFSTMNSPLSLATALVTGLLLLASRPNLAFLLKAAPALLGLALTLVRTAMGGLIVGMLYLVALAPRRVRARMLVAAVAFALTPTVFLALPEVRERLGARLETTANLGEDVSAGARLRQYRAFPERLESSLPGLGLGWIGTYGHLDDRDDIVLDSGVIDIMVSLGLLGATVYFAGAAVCCTRLLAGARRSGDPLAHGCAALVVSGVAQMPLGGMHAGELGFFVWTALGLGLALLWAGERPDPVPPPAPVGYR